MMPIPRFCWNSARIEILRLGCRELAGDLQPSEEVGHGAREMIAHGALDDVSAIVALHVDPTTAGGDLGLTAGPQTAFCQGDFAIEVRGRGGHGARPHDTVD